MRCFRRLDLVVLLAACAVAFPGVCAAQSLAEIAARQKEKRTGKAKVYTEDDLRHTGGRGFTPAQAEGGAEGEPAAAAAPAASSEGGAQAGKSADEQRSEQEKAWRDKLQKTRDNVTQLSAETERLQTALNDLTQPVYGTTRANRVAALEKAKQQLAAAQQSVIDLEEEGRRSGYRP